MSKRLSTAAAAVAAMAGLAAPSPAVAPPGGGTIAIEARTADGVYAATTPLFANALGEALASKGFTILDDSSHAAYVAELIISRDQVGTGLGKAPPGGPKLAPGYAPGVGAGVAIPLSTGNSQVVPLLRTRIEMRIRKRGQDEIIWDGAALTIRETGTRRGTGEAIAAELSGVLVSSYPAQPPEDVGVP